MFYKKRLIVYFIFCSTLFLGLLLGENSSGGSKIDYEYLIPFVKNFSVDFKEGLNSFLVDPSAMIHSPVFYILTGYFLRFTQNILFLKVFYILISCLLPYIFYLIIKTKYNIKKDYIFLFSLLIFLSPYFRSSAIWILGDNLSLLFFSLSILFFLKTKNQKKIILNYYLCFVFLILCCYIRYYYCLFLIYFLINFYKDLNYKFFLRIIVVAFILSLPAVFYFYYIFTYYDFLNSLGKASFNYYSNSLTILSIILFYLLPFIISKIFLIFDFYKKNYKNLLIIFCPIFILYFVDNFFFYNLINFPENGGGVFLKIFDIINFDPNLFLSITAFISLLLMDYFFKGNRLENYLLLTILILCFPLFVIYQKYFDPLFYIFFFGLINSIYFKDMFLNNSISLFFLYGYFSLFYLFSVLYYL